MLGMSIALHELAPMIAQECASEERRLLKAIWHGMRQRCNNPKHPQFRIYGGRGIKCLFSSVDELISAVGARPSREHSVDRIKGDGNYERGNVRWATQQEQCENLRTNAFVTIEGVRHKRVDLVRQYGVTADRIDYGAKVGWPFSKIVSKEPQWDTSSQPLAVAARAEQMRGKPIPHINNTGRRYLYCRKGLHPLVEGNIYKNGNSRKCRQCVIDRRKGG